MCTSVGRHVTLLLNSVAVCLDLCLDSVRKGFRSESSSSAAAASASKNVSTNWDEFTSDPWEVM